MENIYKLDQFLTIKYMKQLVKDNGYNIVNEPPVELKETFEYYKQRLDISSQAPYIMTEEEQIQVKIPVNLEEYYMMKWNIHKVRYLIERENIAKTALPIDRIKASIQQQRDSNSSTSISTKRDDQSIIIGFYPPISSKYLVFQGIESAIDQFDSGAKTIEAYVLEPYIHLQGTTSAVYRNLFAIHFNYSLICSYIAGNITMEELEKRIFPVF
jgi:hypothetical protein